MSTTDMVPEAPLVTYARAADGWRATADGEIPTFTLAVVRVARSMMNRLLPPELTTNACVPGALTATPSGLLPTLNWSTTAFVAVSITESVQENRFVTYTCVPVVLTVMPEGRLPTGISVTTVLLAASITDTVPDSWLAT